MLEGTFQDDALQGKGTYTYEDGSSTGKNLYPHYPKHLILEKLGLKITKLMKLGKTFKSHPVVLT